MDGYTGLPRPSHRDSLPFACDTGQPVPLRSSLFCLLFECVILAVQGQRLYGSPPGHEYLNPLVPTVSYYDTWQVRGAVMQRKIKK